jgi:hypothetical protein
VRRRHLEGTAARVRWRDLGRCQLACYLLPSAGFRLHDKRSLCPYMASLFSHYDGSRRISVAVFLFNRSLTLVPDKFKYSDPQ